MLTLIVATVGRPTLAQAVASAVERLPISEVIIAPAPDAIIPELDIDAVVRVLATTRNLYAAWNLAVTVASGTHVCFLNDDDRLEGPPLDTSWLHHGGPVNLRFEAEGRRTRASISAARANGRVAAVDLFHANRAGNINSYLWPRALVQHFGPFEESYRVCGDIEWMQRIIGTDLEVLWLTHPTYVQHRGDDRLSSFSREPRGQITEARRVVKRMRETHGRFSATSTLGNAWVLSMRLRYLADRDT